MQLRTQQLMQKKDAQLIAIEEAEFRHNTHYMLDKDDAEANKDTQIQALEEAIAELKPDQRACVELFYLHEKCYQEVDRKSVV